MHIHEWTSLRKRQNILRANEMDQQQTLEPGQNQLLRFVSENILFIGNYLDSEIFTVFVI
jgi:hypothetical protein